jgi:hypothetical protein
VTAGLPTPRTSPTAGLVDALRRHTIRQLAARETELRTAIAVEREHLYQLRTSRDFAATAAAGYIDLSFLETP